MSYCFVFLWDCCRSFIQRRMRIAVSYKPSREISEMAGYAVKLLLFFDVYMDVFFVIVYFVN